MSERNEKPTPRRLRKAREDGQVPRSRILAAAMPVLAAGWALGGLGRQWPDAAGFARAAFGGREDPVHLAARALWLLASLGLPVLGAAWVAAGLAGVLQAGFGFFPGQCAPKAERADPLKGLKRVASLQALKESARPAAVAAALALLGAAAVEEAVERCRRVPLPDGVGQAVRSAAPAEALLERVAAALVGFGALDLLLARWLHQRSLRMSRDEVKQEHKQQEGDPHHKSKRKALHRQLALAGPARSVAQATVVVVNPTHIAVALRYAPAECAAPYVVARGRDGDAHAIRKAANQMRVPIVKDIPLARSLVHCEVGDEIPEELFRAAAAILRTVLDPQLLPPPGAAR